MHCEEQPGGHSGKVVVPDCWFGCLKYHLSVFPSCVRHCSYDPTYPKLCSTVFYQFRCPALAWFPSLPLGPVSFLLCPPFYCKPTIKDISPSDCSLLLSDDWILGHRCTIPHACKPVISSVINWGSDCSCFSHLLRDLSATVHIALALSWGQWMICTLSSSRWSQQGHLSKVLCFQWTMFFLCAKWPDICLETYLRLSINDSFIACPMVFQSTVDIIAVEMPCHLVQYCFESWPLLKLWRVLWNCLTMHWLLA